MPSQSNPFEHTGATKCWLNELNVMTVLYDLTCDILYVLSSGLGTFEVAAR